jgi:hypothetical protein
MNYQIIFPKTATSFLEAYSVFKLYNIYICDLKRRDEIDNFLDIKNKVL